MKRWSYTYHICESEKVAKGVCENAMRGMTAYVKKKYPAHITPWNQPGYAGYYIAWVPCYRIV